MINDRSPRDLAMRALRDMGVIRAGWDRSPYAQLVREGFAHAREIPGAAGYGKRDYRLTFAGEMLALELKPWSETQ